MRIFSLARMHTIEMETDNVCLVVEVLFRFIPFGTDIIKQNERRWNKHQNKKKTLCFDCNCSLLTNHFAWSECIRQAHTTTTVHSTNRRNQCTTTCIHTNIRTQREIERKRNTRKMMIKNSHHDYQIIVFLFCRFFSAD